MRKIFTLIGLFVGVANTQAQVTNGLIQHLEFNSSYANEAANITFSATSLTTDREGVANAATLTTNTVKSPAFIPGLNYGNATRTIAFWAKVNTITPNGIYLQAKVVDINGKILQSNSISKTQNLVSFNLGTYPKGIYFIHLLSNN